MMTVETLIEELQKTVDKDRIIVMSKDAEGNRFSPLEYFSFEQYVEDSAYSGDIVLPQGDPNSVSVIVFWPVN